jgi:spore maturation protein CgeB
MKVLVIGKFDSESFGNHICDGLDQLGYSSLKFTKGVKYWHFNIQSLNRLNMVKLAVYNLSQSIPLMRKIEFKSLRKLLDTFKNEISFTIVTHDFLSPIEVQDIKRMTNAPIVIWFPDAIVNFGKAMFLASDYDAFFFKDRYIVDTLCREIKKPIFYLPECCNPIIHNVYTYKYSEIYDYCCDITTAGNFYSNRFALFNQLADYYNDIKIWGNPPTLWMDTSKVNDFLMGKYVVGREKSIAFQLGKIVLNNLHPAEIHGINCRAFEIPAMGGFQLVSWRPAIADLFIEGVEIETYKTFAELLDKINYYLSNDTERRKIIDNGYKRVHKDHTYTNRLIEIFDKF